MYRIDRLPASGLAFRERLEESLVGKMAALSRAQLRTDQEQLRQTADSGYAAS
jgi:hypothetical protein